MSEKKESVGIREIWDTVNTIGVIVIVLSLIGGFVIMIQFGSTETWSGTEIDIVGIATGIGVILQGTVMGVLLMAFSALGRSVNNIENKLIE